MTSTQLVSLATLIIGALLLFFGYRWFRILLAAAGFVLGLLLGLALVSKPALLAWLAGLVLGLVGAALMGFFYLLGVFVLAALATFLIAGTVVGMLFPAAAPVVVLAVSLIGGILGVVLQRYLISGITAAYGASQVILGLSGLAILRAAAPPAGAVWWRRLEPPALPTEPWALILWLVLFLAGFLYQLRSRRLHLPRD